MSNYYAVLIEPAIKMVEGGEFSIQGLPVTMLSLLDKRHDPPAWQEFRDLLGRTVRHERFDQFVRAKNGDGLDTTPDELKRLLELSRQSQAPRAAEAIVAVKAALAGKPGRPKKGKETSVDSTEIEGGAERTDYTLARLQRERPDLYDQVVAEDTTLNKAAVAAGIRRPKTTVYTDDVNKAVATLLKHFTADQIAAALAAQTQGEEQ